MKNRLLTERALREDGSGAAGGAKGRAAGAQRHRQSGRIAARLAEGARADQRAAVRRRRAAARRLGARPARAVGDDALGCRAVGARRARPGRSGERDRGAARRQAPLRSGGRRGRRRASPTSCGGSSAPAKACATRSGRWAGRRGPGKLVLGLALDRLADHYRMPERAGHEDGKCLGAAVGAGAALAAGVGDGADVRVGAAGRAARPDARRGRQLTARPVQPVRLGCGRPGPRPADLGVAHRRGVGVGIASRRAAAVRRRVGDLAGVGIGDPVRGQRRHGRSAP